MPTLNFCIQLFRIGLEQMVLSSKLRDNFTKMVQILLFQTGSFCNQADRFLQPSQSLRPALSLLPIQLTHRSLMFQKIQQVSLLASQRVVQMHRLLFHIQQLIRHLLLCQTHFQMHFRKATASHTMLIALTEPLLPRMCTATNWT